MIRNLFEFPAIIVLLVLMTACSNPEPVDFQPPDTADKNHPGPTVEVRKIGDHFELFRHGKPYWIKGAAGTQHLALLKAAGANSFRTYIEDGLDTLLDQANELGLTVMAGIWLEKEIEGFDYQDPEQVDEQKERIKKLVNEYKEHPALLCWALGNEVVEDTENPVLIAKTIDQLAQVIHELDPNHPVTTVCIKKESLDLLAKEAKHLDFIALNAFGKIIATTEAITSPFLISEWGITGPWEGLNATWGSPSEPNPYNKIKTIEERYHYIEQLKASNCLGSYIFYWGQKQEVTHSWFSLFLENGAKTPMVDALTALWGGRPPENLSPIISDLNFHPWPAKIGINDTLRAVTNAHDPENGKLTFHWEITKDERKFDYIPHEVERRPKAMPGLLIRQAPYELIFQAPSEQGAYRIYVFAYDQFGNGTTSNFLFLVENNALSE